MPSTIHRGKPAEAIRAIQLLGAMALVVPFVALLPLAAHANQGFTDDFEAATISSNWTNASNFTLGPDPHGVLATQTVFPTSGASREYLRTIDTDYTMGDFTSEVVLSNECNGCGSILVFYGLGDGSNTAPNNEPNNGVFLRIHSDGVAGNRVDTAYDRPGFGAGNDMQIIQQGFVNAVPDGEHRAIMQKVGDLLTFSFDVGNDGTVDAVANPIDLTAAPTDFFDSTNSGIFFGTGTQNNTHPLDNFSVTGPPGSSGGGVPEPASIAIWSLLGLVLACLGYRRMRRKQ